MPPQLHHTERALGRHCLTLMPKAPSALLMSNDSPSPLISKASPLLSFRNPALSWLWFQGIQTGARSQLPWHGPGLSKTWLVFSMQQAGRPAEAWLETQPVPELSPEPRAHDASAQSSTHDTFAPQGQDGSSYDRRTEGDVGCGSALSVSDSRSAPCESAAQSEVKTAPSCATKPKNTVVYGPFGQKISLTSSNREEVVAAISSAFSTPADEQHLLQESAPGAETGFFRVERKMDPRSLRFTQSSVSPTFEAHFSAPEAREVDPFRELEPLDVVWHSGRWRSLSNRRLWALKRSSDGMSGQPLCVRARVRPVDAEFHAKNTSANEGVSVMISARSRSPSPVCKAGC